MNDHAVLAAVLRIDLRFFIWKCGPREISRRSPRG
jgi:hypothetical protein